MNVTLQLVIILSTIALQSNGLLNKPPTVRRSAVGQCPSNHDAHQKSSLLSSSNSSGQADSPQQQNTSINHSSDADASKGSDSSTVANRRKEISIFLPDAESCDTYYKCDENGKEIITKCPTDLEFSPTAHACVSPEISGCKAPIRVTMKSKAGTCPSINGVLSTFTVVLACLL